MGILGCAACSPIQWYARQSGRGAVSGFYEGIDSVGDPMRKRVMAQVLTDPSVQKAAHDVTESIVLGAVDGLTQAKLDRLAGRLIENTVSTLRHQGDAAMSQLVNEGGPALERVLHRAITDSILTMGQAMRQTAQTDMGAATTLLMRAAVDGIIQALHQSGEQLGRDLNDNAERFLTDKVAPGAGQIARTFTREAVLGLQDGLSQAGVKDQLPALRMVMHEVGVGLGEGLGVGLGRGVQKSPLEPLLTMATIILGIMLLVALGLLGLVWRRYQAATTSLTLFANEINHAETTESIRLNDLRRAIQEAHLTANNAAYLERFLKRRGLYRPGAIDNRTNGAGRGHAPPDGTSIAETLASLTPKPRPAGPSQQTDGDPLKGKDKQ